MSILKGHLEHFGLQELLQTLSQGARSGTLEICRGEEKVSIVFETGHITLVRSGTARKLRLRSILLREGFVSREDLDQAGRDHEETGILLGRALIDRGVIEESELSKALRKKIEEELFDLFLWTNGSFEFFPEQLKSTVEDDVYHVTRIQVDPMSIIIEGLRQADEWTVIRQRINDFRWILIPNQNVSAPAENNSIYQLIDGSRNIEEILNDSHLTRFDTCTVLYRFLEESLIRKADAEEMTRRARDRAAEDPESALVLYEVLLEDPEASTNPALIEEATDCAGHVEPHYQASFLRKSIDILLENGEEKAAWKKLQRLLVLSPGNLSDLKICWKIRNTIPVKKVPQIHDDLCKALRKNGDHQELVTVLREATALREEEGAFWLQLGEALCRTKDSGAHECLKNAIAISGKNAPDIALRAEKILRTLSPDHRLDEKSLEELLQRQTDIEKKKVQIRTLRFSAIFVFGILTVFQFSAEWRARGMFAAAKQIENNASEISELITAAEAYERVRQLHPWTIAASNSSKEGERMRALVNKEVTTEKDALISSREEARVQRHSLRKHVENTIEQAKELLKNGSAIEARALFDQIENYDTDSLPPGLLAEIQYPVVVDSIPAGARILDRDRKFLGTSPVILTPKKGQVLEVFLEKNGCRSRKLKVTSQSVPHLYVSMVRSPERTLSIAEPAQSLAVLGDLVVTSGRDGRVRILTRDLLNPLHEYSIGLEGHPAPQLISTNDRILVFPLAGRPTVITRDGKSTPIGPVTPAPWTSAAALGEAGWILGDADGNLFLYDHKGQLRATKSLPAPIKSIACSEAGFITAVDIMRNIQRFKIDGSNRSNLQSLEEDLFSFVSTEEYILETGKIISSNKTLDAPAPQSLPRTHKDRHYYNSEKGWVCYSNQDFNEIRFPVRSTCSPIGHSTLEHLTWVAGEDGILRLFSSSGEVMGEVALGASATDMSITETGKLLVSLTDGTLCVVKEQE